MDGEEEFNNLFEEEFEGDKKNNWWEVLGVAENDDQQVINDAFKRLVKKYHPDLYPGDKVVEEKFKKINAARDEANKYLKKNEAEEEKKEGGKKGDIGDDTDKKEEIKQPEKKKSSFTDSHKISDIKDILGTRVAKVEPQPGKYQYKCLVNESGKAISGYYKEIEVLAPGVIIALNKEGEKWFLLNDKGRVDSLPFREIVIEGNEIIGKGFYSKKRIKKMVPTPRITSDNSKMVPTPRITSDNSNKEAE